MQLVAFVMALFLPRDPNPVRHIELASQEGMDAPQLEAELPKRSNLAGLHMAAGEMDKVAVIV